MKSFAFVSLLALVSPASWAAGDWNCGVVNGQNMDIYAGPALAINGVPTPLTAYARTDLTTYYATADGQYIWAANSESSALYSGDRRLLKNCSRARGSSSGKGWFDRLFEDNGYGGMRGDEFIP